MRNRKNQPALKFGNDYAEYREVRASHMLRPGRVVAEVGDGTLKMTTKRLEPGSWIVSDTPGLAIGGSKTAQTPVAVMGRVLAVPFELRSMCTVGTPVCSGPNGTVSMMDRNEVMQYPEAVIGTIAEIPSYEYWGPDNIPVERRIWIRIR